MDIRLQRGTRNGKLTGGRHRDDVWTVTPHRDGDAYGTCPTTCPMLPRAAYTAAVRDGLPVAEDHTGGCYANGRVHHYAVTNGETSTLGDTVAAVLAEGPTLVRWAVVGDIGRDADERADVLGSLLKMHDGGAAVIAYTHAWREVGEAPAPWLNASCDTVADVDHARALGWSPTLVGPADEEASRALARRVGGLVCPAVDDRSSVTGCVGCGGAAGPLCSRERGGAVVVFPAHGAGKGALGATV